MVLQSAVAHRYVPDLASLIRSPERAFGLTEKMCWLAVAGRSDPGHRIAETLRVAFEDQQPVGGQRFGSPTVGK